MSLDPRESIAVIGMAGRFPGAPDIASFWRLLMDQADPISPVPPDRWDASAQLDPEREVPAEGGFIGDVGQFDPTFYGISPREAEDIDPQQRLILEVSWRALEDAGQRASALAGSRTGVYVGASWHDYELLRKEQGAATTQHSLVGNALDVIASRVSYVLGLTGPSLVVESGCSSSLVALHLAAQALRHGEIQAALVGGVSLILAPDVSIGLTHFGGLSPDARSRAFSASANGFVRGEGAVALWLKRLDQALADGDRVHGVIVRTVVNNDGGGDSLVTPSPAGQQDLLRQAYAGAAVPLDKLAYIEAHGTGTPRGDPIEATAIGQVLGQRRAEASGPLWVGSVKTNVGHLEPVAGLAGLVKVLLSITHRVVPATLHADELNPEIPFDELNLAVVRKPLALPEHEPVYLGVNSFGWGGTNAHAVVTGPPPRPSPGPDGDPAGPGMPMLVPLSAHQDEALRQRAADLRDAIAADEIPLASVAGTLAWRRDHFPSRAAFVPSGLNDLGEQLGRFAAGPRGEIPGVVTGRGRPQGRVAFVFPGQGAQWAGMGRDLYAQSATFAAMIQRCAGALEPHVDWDLADVIAGGADGEWLSRIDRVQPVLWAMSAGLAQLWREAGIEPDVVVGHSQGEVAAATVAGILSVDDAALVVGRRSAVLRQLTGRGLMLAVDLDIARIGDVLAGFEESVSLAVNNSPTSCVLSGDTESVLALKEMLEVDGTFCRLVKVDYASHSPQMDTIAGELLAALEPVRPHRGHTPLMSTVLVDTLTGPEMDAAYWTSNLRKPVLFADAMRRLLGEGVTHVVEVSAHPLLTPAIEQLAGERPEPASVLPTLRRDAGSAEDMTLALARAYVSGLEPFGGLTAGTAAELPGYPWQRRSFWVSRPRRRAAAPSGRALSLVPDVQEQGAWQGALELGPDDQPWLSDHRVHGQVVMPAAGMMELALSAARARTGTLPRALTGFRIHRGMTFSTEPIRLSVVWRDDVPGGGSFTLLSLPPGAPEWAEHATARAGPSLPSGAPRPRYPGHLRAAPVRDPGHFYETWAARGLGYGPACQGIERLHVDGDAALGEVRLNDRCRAGARPHGLHPALWDGALQVVLALCEAPETVVPTSARRILILQDPAEPVTRLWSHAVRTDGTHFDVGLFDAGEEPLMMIEGLTVQPLPDNRDRTVEPDRVHHLRFTEEPRAAGNREPGQWVICGADGERVDGLAGALAAAGAGVMPVPAPSGDGLAEAEAWAGRVRAAAEADAVAFVAPAAGAGLAGQQRGLLALTAVVRACLARPAPPRLAVVTADAQGAVTEDRPDAGAALYWGYGRVLRREHGELRPSLIDVTLRDTEWAATCAAELLAGEDEDEVALRGDGRFPGRLVRGGLTAEAGPAKPAWRTPVQPFRLRTGRPGLWESLEYRPLGRRAPGPGEVEIEVTAAALNFIDVMKAMGAYPDASAGASLLGSECAGRVSALGPRVTAFDVGDRVVACVLGALASHVTVRADHVQPIPGDWDDTAAVTLPVATSTAWYSLNDLARLSAGETVLIHSAAGGLGLAAVQVARALGAEIIATAGSERKRDYLHGLGIGHVLSSRDLSWADAVPALTGGRGADVVLNSLGGAAIPLGLDVLAEDGRFIEVGKKDIYGGRRISMAAFRKGITVAAVDLAGLMDRRPERFARLLAAAWDMAAAGKFRPLPVVPYEFAAVAEALRAMSRGDHIGKLVVTNPGSVRAVAPEPMPGGRFRPDGTYLVTGGLGALGLSLAKFLAENGAGAIALMGRTAPGPDAVQRIDALRAGGTRVAAYRADVTSPPALRSAMNRMRAELPPLRGVFHAAGLLDDATIGNLRPEQLDRVLAPKVAGARNLDQATAGDRLDLFVMFSSAAALFGTAGQAAYAAGNAFMDTLALARRRRGQPALSVQWGPFSDIGLAAQDVNRGARLAANGMSGVSPQEAWPALTRFLAADEQTVGYVSLDLRQWFDAYPDTAAQKSWQLLRDAAREGAPGGGVSRDYLTELRGADEGARRDLVEVKVRELAGRVLRLDPEAIEREAPFKALGLDSMLSLELRNRLEAAFGLKLSPSLVWTHGNSRALADELCTRLFTSMPA